MVLTTLENLDELSMDPESRQAEEPYFRDHYARIRIRDFNYQSGFWDDSIPLLQEDDLVIHKKSDKNSVSRNGKLLPPRAIYYMVMDGDLVRIPLVSKDNVYNVKNHIKKFMIDYICNKSELPYMTSVFDVSLKKKITLHYEATEYDKFVIDIIPLEDINVDDSIDKTVDFVRGLKSNNYNEFQPAAKEKITKNIEKISNPYLESLSGFKDKANIYVTNAMIIAKDLRRDMYMEHETFYYIVRVANLHATSDFNQTGTDIKEINIRLSTNIVDKYSLENGDIINFKGQFSNTSKKGTLIQNIKALEKIGKTEANTLDAMIQQYDITVNGNLYTIPLFYHDYGKTNIDVYLIINTEKQKQMTADVRFSIDDKSETISHLFHFNEKKSLEDMIKYYPTIKEQYNKVSTTMEQDITEDKDYNKNFKVIEKYVFEPIDQLMDL